MWLDLLVVVIQQIQVRCLSRLKPLAERKFSADEVINRLRSKLAVVTGATFICKRHKIY